MYDNCGLCKTKEIIHVMQMTKNLIDAGYRGDWNFIFLLTEIAHFRCRIHL